MTSSNARRLALLRALPCLILLLTVGGCASTLPPADFHKPLPRAKPEPQTLEECPDQLPTLALDIDSLPDTITLGQLRSILQQVLDQQTAAGGQYRACRDRHHRAILWINQE